MLCSARRQRSASVSRKRRGARSRRVVVPLTHQPVSLCTAAGSRQLCFDCPPGLSHDNVALPSCWHQPVSLCTAAEVRRDVQEAAEAKKRESADKKKEQQEREREAARRKQARTALALLACRCCVLTERAVRARGASRRVPMHLFL
jgi:hypothetical protein